MTYRSLEVWQIARELSVEIHRMTVDTLPKIEQFEEGQQIRRSIKSVRSNIVEGYGRRRYKHDFIRFLTYAFASSLETVDHLECLWETGSLSDRDRYEATQARLVELGRKLNKLIQSVDDSHQSVREHSSLYFEGTANESERQQSNIKYPTSDTDADQSDEDES